MKDKQILSIILVLFLIFSTIVCSQVETINIANLNLRRIIDKIYRNQNEFILYDSSYLFKLKDSSNINDTVKYSVEKIVELANYDLNIKTLSVTQKRSLIQGIDPHEYVSMSIYYWPDTSKVDGKPYVFKDGQVNPEIYDNDKYDATRLSEMTSAVSTLSIAYYLTGQKVYAEHSAKLLRAWFLDSDTKMNPNLEYSQGVPGKDTGGASGIIDTVAFISIIDSVKMLEKSEAWTQEDSTELKKWFADYVEWLQQSAFGKSEANAPNNHSVWYDAQVASFSYYAGNKDVARNIVEGSKMKRIATQIEKNGSMPNELSRTCSMDYTMYNLEAFTTLAQVGEKVGVDLWNYTSEDGKSIKLAYSYLYPYLSGKSNWQYQNIVQENSKSFAPYLAIAAQKLYNYNYGKMAVKLVPEDVGRERIMVYSFSYTIDSGSKFFVTLKSFFNLIFCSFLEL